MTVKMTADEVVALSVSVGVQRELEGCRMGDRLVRRTAQRAALDAHGGSGVSGTAGSTPWRSGCWSLLSERDAAERRAGNLLQKMIDREQLSPRQAVAWLGDAITAAAQRV